MAVQKSIRMKKLVRKVKPRNGKKSARAKWLTSTPVIAGGIIAVFVAAVLAGLYRAGAENARPKAESKTARVEDTASTATPIASLASHPTADADASRTTTDSQEPHRSKAVTITGCLERSDATFRLTETAGVTAPTSRSWKSAFLKKRSAPVDIIAPRPLNLASYAGERISVTGMLVDRQMHVGSLHRIASSCAAPQKVKA